MDTGYDLLAASRTAQGELPYVDYDYFYGPLGTAPARRDLRRHRAPPSGPPPRSASCSSAARHGADLPARAPLRRAAGRRGRRRARRGRRAVERQQLVRAAALDLRAAGDRARARRDPAGSPASRSPRCRASGSLKAGAACGLVALTRPELALALFGAVAVWLAVEIWHARDARRPAWRAAALVAAPALALPAGRLRRLPDRGLAARAAAREPLPDRLRPRRGPRRARRARAADGGQHRQARRARARVRGRRRRARRGRPRARRGRPPSHARARRDRRRRARLRRRRSSCGPRPSAATWSSATTGSRPGRGSPPPC